MKLEEKQRLELSLKTARSNIENVAKCLKADNRGEYNIPDVRADLSRLEKMVHGIFCEKN